MLTLQESRDALLGVEQVTSGANHLMAKKKSGTSPADKATSFPAANMGSNP